MLASKEHLRQLAELADALSNVGFLESACDALESNRFEILSTSVARGVLSAGSSDADASLRALQRLWRTAFSGCNGCELASYLRVAAVASEFTRRSIGRADAVWTGPCVDGSYFRKTREVVREILRCAKTELLVVGYWIAAREDGDGIIEEAIQSIAEAAHRGVRLTFIVDERERSDGRDNKKILESLWPADVGKPRILTWRLPPNDQHLKLHAKVIVADRQEALVSSANFTLYAMEKNIELGVRVSGDLALQIAKHFSLLESHKILEVYE